MRLAIRFAPKPPIAKALVRSSLRRVLGKLGRVKVHRGSQRACFVEVSFKTAPEIHLVLPALGEFFNSFGIPKAQMEIDGREFHFLMTERRIVSNS